MTDFYKKEDESPEESGKEFSEEKIKLGDKEYSQEELTKIVGLGELATELETKWNTPLDKVVPEYTKKSQRLAEIEKEYEALKKKEEEANNQPQPGEPSPEEKERARKALVELLGGEVVRKEDFDQLYATRRQGERLLEEIDALVADAKEYGKPVPEKESLLKYMSETGINSPDKAYKLMFEEQLDKWKEDQLKKAKPTGLTTEGRSPGDKQPEPVKPTRDNLGDLISSVVNRE